MLSRMRWTSSSVKSLVRLVGSTWARAQTFRALVLPIPYRYVSEIWICFSRGRSTPERRAIRYPCLCLWRGFAAQITRTTPLRRITLHFTQIFLTEARTFTASSSRNLKNSGTTERFAPFRAAPRLPPPRRLGPPRQGGSGADNKGAAQCQDSRRSRAAPRFQGGRSCARSARAPQRWRVAALTHEHCLGPVKAATHTCIEGESSPGLTSSSDSPFCSTAEGPGPRQSSVGLLRAAIASPSSTGCEALLVTTERTLSFTFWTVAVSAPGPTASVAGSIRSAVIEVVCGSSLPCTV